MSFFDLKKCTVLLVDDDESIVKLMRLRLQKIFQTVKSAGNGLDALSILPSTNPDLLITDINMPKMNGIELIREVQRIRPDLPILAVTAYNTDEYKNDLQVLGIKFLVKPVKKEDMERAIFEVMNFPVKKAA